MLSVYNIEYSHYYWSLSHRNENNKTIIGINTPIHLCNIAFKRSKNVLNYVVTYLYIYIFFFTRYANITCTDTQSPIAHAILLGPDNRTDRLPRTCFSTAHDFFAENKWKM